MSYSPAYCHYVKYLSRKKTDVKPASKSFISKKKTTIVRKIVIENSARKNNHENDKNNGKKIKTFKKIDRKAGSVFVGGCLSRTILISSSQKQGWNRTLFDNTNIKNDWILSHQTQNSNWKRGNGC